MCLKRIGKREDWMRPIMKWAGGKTQLLSQIKSLLPREYGDYYEPFIGGAALLFDLVPHNAIISDVNEQLVNVYQQLRQDPQEVISVVNRYDAIPECSNDIYLQLREKYNQKILEHELDAECAGLMIWINKHCFNGLYRVNSKGLFNVPFNNKISGKSIDEDNLVNVGKYLQTANIDIRCNDFEDTCQNVKSGDFVYFDSPYVPESATASFTDYTKSGFSLNDHKRLADLFKRLDSIGAKVMLSNNDVDLVNELYNGYNIHHIDVRRCINSDASKRNGKEVIITNYSVEG